jgi:thiopeptide-type bacteriocin biosynthesis protein
MPQGDNELPLDFHNPFSVDVFLSEVRRRRYVDLVEFFPHPDDLPVEGEDGRFAAEIVVPFLFKPRSQLRTSAAPAAKYPSFAHGSEFDGDWTFLKLYCGPSAADKLLRDEVAEMVASLRDHGAIRQWFFIRYADPDFHLRLRLRKSSSTDAGTLLFTRISKLTKALLDSKGIYKWQLDTYQPETTRYGGQEGIEAAYSIFEAESDAVVDMLRAPEFMGDGEYRWLETLRGLVDLGTALEPQSVLSLFEVALERARPLADLGRQAPKLLAQRYRASRTPIEQIVVGSVDSLPNALAAIALRRRERTRVACDTYRSINAREGLISPLRECAIALLHMNVNRSMRFEARLHERILYDFAGRALRSVAARTAQPSRQE